MIAILEAHRAGLLGPRRWLPNIIAGTVVGIVALPLAMAFAIASGARPEQGLYTAIVAGLAGSLFGGSRLQISGPTGAFVVILSGVTAQHGFAGLQLATLMAGVILVAMGLARLGSVIKFIPDPVVVGFTAGIALIIWVGQWQDFSGLPPLPGGLHFHQKFWLLVQALPHYHPGTTLLGLLTLLILVVTPGLMKRVPAPLVAMVAVTALQRQLHLEGVATLGSAFGGIPHTLPGFALPEVTFPMVLTLIGPAFTIAMLGAIESLLSAVVADGMAGTRHDSNQELIGQGIANLLTPLFGGFAATGAIARTATSVRNGATGPVAGIVHALTLVAIVLLLAPLAGDVPLSVLAAILVVVAWNMFAMHHFIHLVRTAPRPDVLVLLITFALTVLSDLVIAVNVGVMLAALLFMRRMAQAVQVQEQTEEQLASEIGADAALPLVPRGTVVYAIDGPFFFGAAERLTDTLENIQQHADTVVIRMARVPFMDATGLQSLAETVADFHRRGTRVVLCEVQPNVLAKLERAGILELVGRERIVADLSDVLAQR